MFSASISAELGTTFPNYSTFLFTVCVIWLETCVPFSFDVQLYNYWGFCDAVVVANFICLNIQIIYNEKGNLLLDGYWKLFPRSTSTVHSTNFFILQHYWHSYKWLKPGILLWYYATYSFGSNVFWQSCESVLAVTTVYTGAPYCKLNVLKKENSKKVVSSVV